MSEGQPGDIVRYGRFPYKDDFYAMRSPLCLAQVTEPSQDGGITCLHLWTPYEDRERMYDRRAFIPGDVWLVMGKNYLWFVGPETDRATLHVLASVRIHDEDISASILYQPGAGRHKHKSLFVELGEWDEMKAEAKKKIATLKQSLTGDDATVLALLAQAPDMAKKEQQKLVKSLTGEARRIADLIVKHDPENRGHAAQAAKAFIAWAKALKPAKMV